MKNVLWSFDIFKREAVSILRTKFLTFLFLENDSLQKGVVADVMDDEVTQITVINNQNVYNLLSTVALKRKLAMKR